MVVLSGGQDSTTCLFWAVRHFEKVHAVTFDYGQRHLREIEAAKNVARLAGVATHEIVKVGDILKGRSPLTDHTAKLETYASAAEMEEVIGERVELTFVPARNALFLCLAANRADCLGIRDLVTGVCQADNANYPDCREVFIDAMSEALRTALGVDKNSQMFHIHTPLMHKSKPESIRFALTIPGAYEALAYTHTAYSGEYPPVTQDHATVLRAWGFEQAGVPDPLIVRAWREGLMPLPSTSNYNKVQESANDQYEA